MKPLSVIDNCKDSKGQLKLLELLEIKGIDKPGQYGYTIDL